MFKLEEGTLAAYLREVNEYPLLNYQEVIKLAQVFEKGKKAQVKLDALKERTKRNCGREAKLIAIVECGQTARRALIEGNLRLVVSIAQRYRSHSLSFSDLIGEGNCGLIVAVERFDWRLGNQFATYAIWWIKNFILAALKKQAGIIVIPKYMMDRISKYRSVEKNLLMGLGRKPSLEEIAMAMGLSRQEVRKIEEALVHVSSLEALATEDERSFRYFPGEEKSSPLETLENLSLGEILTRAFKKLDLMEQEVISMRFGLKGGEKATLEEIGKKFGVCRERIRQIEARALEKMRKDEAIKPF